MSVSGSHVSTLECLYDCLLDIMFLFCRNKLILILILCSNRKKEEKVSPETTVDRDQNFLALNSQ